MACASGDSGPPPSQCTAAIRAWLERCARAYAVAALNPAIFTKETLGGVSYRAVTGVIFPGKASLTCADFLVSSDKTCIVCAESDDCVRIAAAVSGISVPVPASAAHPLHGASLCVHWGGGAAGLTAFVVLATP